MRRGRGGKSKIEQKLGAGAKQLNKNFRNDTCIGFDDENLGQFWGQTPWQPVDGALGESGPGEVEVAEGGG